MKINKITGLYIRKKIFEFSLLALLFGCLPDNNEGVTPLMMAARDGDPERTTQLIIAGNDVSALSSYNWTALTFAARNGSLAVVKALVEAGSNVDHVTAEVQPGIMATRGGYYPTTALAEAIRYGHDDVAEYLLTYKTQIHPIEVIAAAQYEKSAWLIKLVERGGDPSVQTGLTYYRSALHAVAASGNVKIMAWLIEERGVDITHGVIEQAVRGDHPEMVNLLLANGANPNESYRDTTMPTLLITAIKKPQYNANHDSNLKIIKSLIEAGADPCRAPEYSFFGLGIVGENRSAIDVAKGRVEELSGYYENETDPEWKERKLENLNHIKATLEILKK